MYPSNTNIDHHSSMIITSNCSNEDHEEDPYSSFYNFPSPYIHYEDGEILLQHLHDLFSQQHQTTTSSSPPPSPPQPPPPQEDQPPLANGGSMPPALRLTRKCDRHSKIHTAQGTRDRRMRLSLQVARPFFDLQDMLGFDKASKTVDWLLKQSKTAIKELYGGNTDNTYESVLPEKLDHSASDERRKSQIPKGKKNRVRRKFAFDPNAKETREKARARARERTMEKRKPHESRLAKNSLQDGGNVIASDCFVERPVSQQLHVSDYDVHGQIW